MKPCGIPDLTDMRDALAWARASLAGDLDARQVIGANCDTLGLVDSLCWLFLAAVRSGGLDPDAYLTELQHTIGRLFPDEDSPQ
jgi:hypothetical protein